MEYRYRDASEMKDSGVEWIGKIPKDISIKRLKYDLVFQKGNNPREINNEGNGIPYIGASDFGSKKYSQYTTDINLPICIEEDLLILWDGARAGIVDYGHKGAISSTVVKVENKNNLFLKKYYNWYMKSFEKYFVDMSNGTTIPHMNRKFLENLLIPEISLKDQNKISNFLDRKTSQFDSIISKKEALIEKLEEAKKSLISEVVTGKVKVVKTNDGYYLVKRNSNEMKYSGVEWLGEIPKDWEVNKLSNIAELTRLAGAEYTSYWETDDDGEIIALRGQNIGINELNLNNIERISSKLSNRLNRSKLYKGDIVFPCVGSIGKATLIKEDNKYHINQNIAKITHNDKIVPELLSYLLNSNECHKQITWFNSSQMQPSVLIRDLRQFKFALSYDKLEQVEICEFLELKLHYMNKILNNTKNQIQKLKEAKQSLISEAVTGKIEILD